MVKRLLIALSAMMTLVIAGAGCSSQKEVAGTVASRSVRDFQKDLDAVPGQIDSVMSSLTKLTAGDTADRASALTSYSKDLKELTSQASRIASARDQAESDTQRYFREWLKESRSIKSSSERDAAYQALDAGKARTDIALGYLDNAATEYRALAEQFTQIQSMLTKDLSASSVQQVASQLGPVFDKASATKNYVARLSEQIDAALLGK